MLDRTVADQVSIWKSRRGLTDDAAIGHICSGNTCSYSHIGDVFICERTGRVHGMNTSPPPFFSLFQGLLPPD